jgi:hypothetical protein
MKGLIYEDSNPSLILELLDNEPENPVVLLIHIKSSIRIQNLRIVDLKMTKIQVSDGRLDKHKIAILNIDFILNYFFMGQLR